MLEGVVSTVIPVHNRPGLLTEAVGSVLVQRYPAIEIIIVDDGSTDETGSVAQDLARRHSVIRVVHRENGGPGLARETGRRQARGEFIQYLDSDDLLLAGKFEAQVHSLRANPAAGVAYGYTSYRDEWGTLALSRWKETGHVARRLFPSFLRERWWDTPTPLYRAGVCEAAGPWTALRVEEDWEYDCRVAALGVGLSFVPRFVAEVRRHGAPHVSGRNDVASLADRARAHELILGHALRAGVERQGAEAGHFARELFLLARQCGAVGLVAESRRLVQLAQEAASPRPADVAAYRRLAGLVGWQRLGRWACWTDGLRGLKP